jgi:hypothetical protein
MLNVATLGYLVANATLTVQAHDLPQPCLIRLTSDDFVLNQLQGSQIQGIRNTSEANGDAATLFHLRNGTLYDSQLRGCLWAGMLWSPFYH